MEEYKAILNCINNELKNNEDTIKYLRENVADLEREKAFLVKENAELKEEIENLTF